MARDMEWARAFVPELTPSDIFRGITPITLGGVRFELPAGSIERDERWVATVDHAFSGMMEAARIAEDDTTSILKVMQASTDMLLDLLLDYDAEGVLPDRDTIRRIGRSHELVRAVFTLWIAANPTLAVAVMDAGTALMLSTSPEPTSGSQPSTDGLLDASGPSSPPHSSSPTSTPAKSASTAGSARASKRRASGQPSPATRRHTTAGAGRQARAARGAAASQAQT